MENILYSSNARQTGGEASIPQVYKLKVLKGGDRRARGCAVWDRRALISKRFNTLSSLGEKKKNKKWGMFNIRLNSCSSFTTPGLWNMRHCKHHLLFVVRATASGLSDVVVVEEHHQSSSPLDVNMTSPSLFYYKWAKALLNPFRVGRLLSPCIPPPWLSARAAAIYSTANFLIVI